jgi:hypothetical protein
VTDVKVYRNGARAGGVQRFRSLTPVTLQAYPPVRGKCAHALARAALAVVLVLVCVAAMLWTKYGPQGAWTPVWVLLAAVVISCAVLTWYALQPRRERGGP